MHQTHPPLHLTPPAPLTNANRASRTTPATHSTATLCCRTNTPWGNPQTRRPKSIGTRLNSCCGGAARRWNPARSARKTVSPSPWQHSAGTSSAPRVCRGRWTPWAKMRSIARSATLQSSNATLDS